MKTMTVKQLDKVCQENRYILARYPDGHLMGINCKVAEIARKKKVYAEDAPTDFISWQSCDFMEYINFKHPFVV